MPSTPKAFALIMCSASATAYICARCSLRRSSIMPISVLSTLACCSTFKPTIGSHLPATGATGKNQPTTVLADGVGESFVDDPKHKTQVVDVRGMTQAIFPRHTNTLCVYATAYVFL